MEEAQVCADERCDVFFRFAVETYEARYGELLVFRDDYRAVDQLLRLAKSGLPEIQRRWQNFLDCPDPYVRRQGRPLRYFCLNFNGFAVGKPTHVHTERCREYGFCPDER